MTTAAQTSIPHLRHAPLKNLSQDPGIPLRSRVYAARRSALTKTLQAKSKEG
ncbi:unnamed protein product [Discula destructiva]